MVKGELKKKIRRFNKKVNKRIQQISGNIQTTMSDSFKKHFPKLVEKQAAKKAAKQEISREELKRRITTCDKLGASKFQPIVLKAEELKFRVLKDVFPGIQTRYEKYCRKKRDEALEDAETEEERQVALERYRRQILEWRKEIKREKNRNYHMDENKPTEIIQYLEWNKHVHQKGLIVNAAVITGAAILLGVEPKLAEALMESSPAIAEAITETLPMLAGTTIGLEGISGLINFQCVNLQNSHIYRYRLTERVLKRQEARKNAQLIEKYGALVPVFEACKKESIEVPTIQDLIDHIETPEQAAQLRQMITERLAIEQKGKTQSQEPKTVEKKDEKNSSHTSNIEPSENIVQTTSVVSETDSSKPIPETSQDIRGNVNNEIQRMVTESITTGQELAVQKSLGGKS